jgi:hypothetical protein
MFAACQAALSFLKAKAKPHTPLLPLGGAAFMPGALSCGSSCEASEGHQAWASSDLSAQCSAFCLVSHTQNTAFYSFLLLSPRVWVPGA